MVLATYLVRRPSEWTRDESRQACRGTSVAGDGRTPRGTDESGDGHGEDEDEGREYCSSRREASLRRGHKRYTLDIARGVRESERRRSSERCVIGGRAVLEWGRYVTVEGGRASSLWRRRMMVGYRTEQG